MASDMILRKLVPLAALLVLFVTGCQNKPDTQDNGVSAVKSSNHLVRELCDFPKPFFTERFHTANIVVTSDLHAMTDEIGTIGGCTYRTEDNHYLGTIVLRNSSADATSTSTGNRVGRTVRIDDITVTEFIEPVPAPGDPNSQPPITFAATLNGWDSEMSYYAPDPTDDPTLRIGAQTLVNVLRTLTN